MIPEPATTEKKHFMGYPHHISLVTRIDTFYKLTLKFFYL